MGGGEGEKVRGGESKAMVTGRQRPSNRQQGLVYSYFPRITYVNSGARSQPFLGQPLLLN